MGRKKATPTKATSLRLSPELAAELSAVARADGVPISDVVREAISKHIATRRADEDFQARLKEQMEEDRKVLERLVE
ncbi:MAG TPA: ribbon-helix-helix protein, CopG family [Solirubrobacterales bacterium]|nr:ribbon-helix-helix protein, CopG family [Solirubrobacterales bacterium]